ncbi:MAG: M48 family metalloprotease [Alphaproteobacteria bacterium]|nr:M48 family metalloprotease [Alphaproteobacteria bacterium]
MSRRARIAAAIAAAACLVATPAVAADPPPGAPGLAPASVAASNTDAPGRPSDKLEADLRYQADELEKALRQAARLVRDPDLTAFVRGLGCVAAGARCGDVRFYVVREPSFNASMFPNGMSVVHTGLLLRVESEAELAFILGHEYTHYAHRHSLKEAARLKGGLFAANIFSIAMVIGGVGSMSSAAYLPVAADAAAFSQDMEREADLTALAALKAANLDARVAITSFVNIQAEDLASSDPKRRKAARTVDLFASHPLTKDRIAYLTAAVGAAPNGPTGAAPPGAREKSAYRARIRPMLVDWLNDELARRDAGAMLQVLDRLATLGEDQGVLAFYRGETFRARGGAGDLDLALAQYQAAVAAPDAPVTAWRQLGAAAARLGKRAEARAAFATYLARAPDAPDAALIAHTLDGLKEEPRP